MKKREEIIVEAREWVFTRYLHQASLKQVGADCVGLIRGVGFATGVLPAKEAEWKRFNAYGRLPNPRRMAEGMQTFLCPVSGRGKMGDIVWLHWRENLPMHLAILSQDSDGNPAIIHSLSDFGMVVEHGLTKQWEDRIESCWRYPDLPEDEI